MSSDSVIDKVLEDIDKMKQGVIPSFMAGVRVEAWRGKLEMPDGLARELAYSVTKAAILTKMAMIEGRKVADDMYTLLLLMAHHVEVMVMTEDEMRKRGKSE